MQRSLRAQQVGLRLEYEDFGKFGDDGVIGRHRADMWTLGLDYKFSRF